MTQPQPNNNPPGAPTPPTNTPGASLPRPETKKKPAAAAPASSETPGARPLSNPFLDTKPKSNALLPAGLAPWHIFVLCLVLGLVTVGLRAKRRSDDSHARARTAAQARAAAVESQFDQAVSAAELLGALVRQAGGAMPNFQKIATELLAARPAVASLELQPGGAISDIVPRSGNERAIGFNVLNHPTYGPGAKLVIQKRALSVQGPVPLYRGGSGIIAREPIFLRGRDGRDAFWGFVAVSLKLSDAFARARLDDLHRQGYSYILFAPAAEGRKPLTLAAHGAVSVGNPVQQSVRARDAEFQLALQPRGGWVSKTKLVLEFLAVIAGSALLGLLLTLLESRRAIEAELAEKTDRLDSESRDRKQALDDWRTSKDEAAAIRAELTQAREKLQASTEQEVRLNAAVRAAEAAAQAKQAEVDQLRAAQQQAEQLIRSLQSRLTDAAQAEKDTAEAFQAKLKAAQETAAALEARLETESPRPAQVADGVAQAQEPEEVTLPQPASPAAEASTEATRETSDAPTAPVTEPAPAADAPAPNLPEEATAERTSEPAQASAEPKPVRTARRKKPRPDNQMDLFGAEAAPLPREGERPREPKLTEPPADESVRPPEPALEPAAESATHPPAAPKPDREPKDVRRSRRLPPTPPVNPPVLRKAANQILPLFTGQDPGAWDCLKDNREAFRSAFDPEDYVAFEQMVKKGEFEAALEELKRAVKKHGITV